MKLETFLKQATKIGSGNRCRIKIDGKVIENARLEIYFNSWTKVSGDYNFYVVDQKVADRISYLRPVKEIKPILKRGTRPYSEIKQLMKEIAKEEKDTKIIKESANKINMSEKKADKLISEIRDTLPINKEKKKELICPSCRISDCDHAGKEINFNTKKSIKYSTITKAFETKCHKVTVRVQVEIQEKGGKI